jgi:EAL domain-containing protein (putative c-di-GMP-specific phosphodiesterase class I)
MRADEVVAHESLIRGPVGTPFEFPDALFQTARTNNSVIELDLLCMRKVLEASDELHHGIKLFMNVFPETLLEEKRLYSEILSDPRMRQIDVIFELSGSNRASDASDLFSSLKRLRGTGRKICMDANVALLGHGLKFLPELRPNYIKLNMMHFREMVGDYEKQGDFIKTVNLIRAAGSEVICTKLESRADSFLALKAGVNLGQGFLFARPAQAPTEPPPK